MYVSLCMTQNMSVIFFENGGVWHKMYDTKIATSIGCQEVYMDAFRDFSLTVIYERNLTGQANKLPWEKAQYNKTNAILKFQNACATPIKTKINY